MEIDKDLIKQMRVEVLQALSAIATRHGLNVEQQRNVSYNSDSFGIKYTFSNADIDLARKDFESKCWKYSGLKPEHYGATFQDGNDTIVVTGLNTRAPKYPILFTKNGKQMKMGADLMMLKLRKAGL